MDKERIGLFGGTFNPIHRGHLRAAGIVRQVFALNNVLFIPSYIPPHKATLDMAPPRDRLRMVELAVEGHPGFTACAVEVEAEEKSYSVMTLEKIKKIYPRALLFFILGVDAFLEIDTWREYERVLAQCSFIVISRPGHVLDRARDVLGGRYREETYELSSKEPIEEVRLSSSKIFLLTLDALDISSTEIRRRVRSGESLKGLVSGAVEDYIGEKRLYLWQK
jgi:nicotinate-nucleotide adenylyltransferase